MAGRKLSVVGGQTPTRTWVEVDLAALRHNVEAITAWLDDRKLMAVVKADAYGHGATAVAQVMADLAVDYLAVASYDEGHRLRKAGVQLPVLVLGWTPPEHAPQVVKSELTQTVFRLEDARVLAQAAARAGRTVRVHAKVDTGMGRLGMPLLKDGERQLGRVVASLCAVAELEALELEGLFTHFARADEDEAVTRQQFTRFERLVAACLQQGLRFEHLHAANSAAMWTFPWTHLTMVRPGISLYGYPPAAGMELPVALEPVLSWHARLAYIKTVPAGTGISYGHSYRAPRRQRLATVSVGYADGYPRALSNVGQVLLAGQRLPVVGRVCMDQLMVALPDSLAATAGDAVVLVGEDAGATISPVDLAAQLGTIQYEVLAAIGARVPRINLDGSKTAT